MKGIILVLSMIGQFAFAQQEDWFCTQDTSERRGNTYVTCGQGTSMNKEFARGFALRFAISEFQTICMESDDCRDKKRTVEPKRTTCSFDRNTEFWTCQRMIEVTVDAD